MSEAQQRGLSNDFTPTRMKSDFPKPKTVRDLVVDVLSTAIAAILCTTLLAAAMLLILSPGIIINWMRGRYKNSPHGLIRASIRDWQTWLISLPIAATLFFILNTCGVFSEPTQPAKTPSLSGTVVDGSYSEGNKGGKFPAGTSVSTNMEVKSVVPPYMRPQHFVPYALPPSKAAGKKPVHQVSREEWIKLHQGP